MRLRDDDGFLLMEAVVALAIFGIIASISIPAYGSFVVRQRSVDHRNAVAAAIPAIEAYRQDQGGSYVGMTFDALRAIDQRVEAVVVLHSDMTTYCIRSESEEQPWYRTQSTNVSEMPC